VNLICLFQGVYYSLFDELFKLHLPELHAHLKSLGIVSSMYLMNWFQTLFLQVLPLEICARVFDCFLLDGAVFLFRTAIAIHQLLLPRLLQAEIEVAMPLLQKSHAHQAVWEELLTEKVLFGTIFSIVVPSNIYTSLDRVINDVFFYEKKYTAPATSSNISNTSSSPGFFRQPFGISLTGAGTWGGSGSSGGIDRVKHERRSIYANSDTINGVLGGF